MNTSFYTNGSGDCTSKMRKRGRVEKRERRRERKKWKEKNGEKTPLLRLCVF